MKPEELYFTPTHEWVAVAEVDGAKVVTVGITDFAAEQLGDVVHVILPEVGRTLVAEEPFGEIESYKSVNDLYAPLAGEVVEVNSALATAPEQVNQDPYGAGWMLKIRLADASSLEKMLRREAYLRQIAGDGDS